MVIPDFLDAENSGKYKQVEVYGKKPDGTFGLKSSLEQLLPSTAYKKTALFGLFYDVNEMTGDDDEWGYPIVKESFMFSPEEVLIKLFALKEKLKKDYLPLNARIVDITGEGFYFSVNKTRGWVDTLKIDEISLGVDVEMSATPSIGYIEDLRPFQSRTNSSLPQLPFVPGYEGDDSASTFGNDSEVTPFNQYYTRSQAIALSDAISKYYENLKNNGNRLDLGDGDYNGSGYYKFSDGSKYYLPAGFPTVLEVTSFNLTIDQVQTQWGNLDRNIDVYISQISSTSDLTGYVGDTLITSSFTDTIDLDSLTFGEIISITLPTGFTDFLSPVNIGTILNPDYYRTHLKIKSGDNYLVGEVASYNNLTGATTFKVLYKTGQ
jgi:hypothetical protein